MNGQTLLLALAAAFALAKLVSALLVAIWPGGTAAIAASRLGRCVYASGKTTPVLLALTLLLYAVLFEPPAQLRAWLALALLLGAALALPIIHLRRSRRGRGGAHPPRQWSRIVRLR
ncbi:hypothetical protein JR064_03240 [Xanthomonas sp. CFBP 8703]|uniref:Uncharacterized protein n=1 Tax=Xanthomonas bonasiae TaxID=2810351 RepID=A0ABS3AYJ9_9XANT|nr:MULTISPECIES: hypothetical protein [Xanthomonas]MBN6101177.1 hypothetical protein [Xanthomonas bonasiae]MBN6112027.1 hypothetical protein [Xanthomonas bonasiae]NYF19758.1 hypothetical protein [Xanthomonas sp. JAI131]